MDDTLSSQWRVNRSPIKELEYAEVLRSLRRLALHHTKHITSLGYDAEDSQDIACQMRGHILINPAPIKEAGEFPVSPAVFDVLCGLVIHETGHELVGSDEVNEVLHGEEGLVSPIKMIGEDIVVDNYFQKNSKQKAYIKKSRVHFKEGIEQIEVTGNPVVDACRGFAGTMLYNLPLPPDLSKPAFDCLQILFKELKGITGMGAASRARAYIQAASLIQQALKTETAKRRIQDPRGKRLRAFSSIEAFDRKMREDIAKEAVDTMGQALGQSAKEGQKMTEEEAQAVREALVTEASDVTEFIDSLTKTNTNHEANRETGSYYRRRTRVIARVSAAKHYTIPDEALSKELLWLKNVKTSKDTIIERQLTEGKVDKRHLYRFALDGRIFRQRKIKKHQKRRLWLLMDGSGSMDRSSLFSPCASVRKALEDSRVYMYYERGSNTHIIRLDDRRGMKEEGTADGTPSGDAITFVAYLLQKAGGGILVHFTDGGTNYGILPADAFEFVQEKCPKVALINVSDSSLSPLWSSKSQRIKNVTVDATDVKKFSSLLKDAVSELWGLV